MSEAIDRSDATEEAVRQLLTFTLADVTYALPIESVKEIRGYSGVTPVPGAPVHVRGVMNLRGQVIPVTDLRLRFGLDEREYDRFTVVILVEVAERVVGLVVDAVSDVIDVDPTALAEVPDMGAGVDQAHLEGMVTSERGVVLALHVDSVAGAVELEDADASRREQDAA